ncbi:hypothetical protein [Acaryochloris sp. IP29b_bin.137]|uniref:hypothetical protein n=1 Tax=Acaryochloris sp. IP29b_bin.137 TaxID=2969217 RepID=UPI00262D518C|nr:hypothetical protein [Acaryochloris sp. IP29b_bin.137]
MGEYANEDWYHNHVIEMIEKHGDFPPPWIFMKNSHPYSIGWRMGAGETHVMVFGEWWEQQNKTVEERIEYFRKWPAPPRWCAWMADTIWDLEPWECEDEFDYSPYFAKLKALGFHGTDDYESDLDNDTYI